MIIESGVYLVIFASTYLIDYRKKYIDSETGKKDTSKFRAYVKKIIADINVSELVYMIMKFMSIYRIVQSNIAPPYQVAMIGTLLAGIAYIITANAIARWQKLFKWSENTSSIPFNLSVRPPG